LNEISANGAYLSPNQCDQMIFNIFIF